MLRILDKHQLGSALQLVDLRSKIVLLVGDDLLEHLDALSEMIELMVDVIIDRGLFF